MQRGLLVVGSGTHVDELALFLVEEGAYQRCRARARRRDEQRLAVWPVRGEQCLLELGALRDGVAVVILTTRRAPPRVPGDSFEAAAPRRAFVEKRASLGDTTGV